MLARSVSLFERVMYICPFSSFADLDETTLKYWCVLEHIIHSFFVQLLLKFPLEVLNMPTAQQLLWTE